VSLAPSLTSPAVVYREEQNFAWWIYALLGLMFVVAGFSPGWTNAGAGNAVGAAKGWNLTIPISLAVGLAVPTILVLGVLRMTTEVRPGDVRVWFGWIPTYQECVDLSSIERIEVVTFRPIAEHGFWGVRRGADGERVLTARGNRGVRLHMADGGRVLIGSQKPEVLAQAIEKALRPEG
jgi:hypothetical protein